MFVNYYASVHICLYAHVRTNLNQIWRVPSQGTWDLVINDLIPSSSKHTSHPSFKYHWFCRTMFPIRISITKLPFLELLLKVVKFFAGCLLSPEYSSRDARQSLVHIPIYLINRCVAMDVGYTSS